MSSATERNAFQQFSERMQELAQKNPNCRVDLPSSKSVLILFGEEDNFSHIEVGIGNFNVWLSICDCLVGNAPLSNDHEVNRLLAFCDSILAGQAKTVSHKYTSLSRTWLFLDSRGIKETVRLTRAPLGSRGRAVPKSQWQRHKLPNLTNEIA